MFHVRWTRFTYRFHSYAELNCYIHSTYKFDPVNRNIHRNLHWCLKVFGENSFEIPDGPVEAAEERFGGEDAHRIGIPRDTEASVGEAAWLAGESEAVIRQASSACAPVEGGSSRTGQALVGAALGR